MSEAVTVPKVDDDDFNSFRGIACEGQTHRQTHGHRLGSVIFLKVYFADKKRAYTIMRNPHFLTATRTVTTLITIESWILCVWTI